MQKHTILLNLNFSANTEDSQSTNSPMSIFGNYQVNNIQGLGGGITNPSNIRGFISNGSNNIIVDDFLSYLSGETSNIEFYEIFNSDEKLSKVFNNYYESSVLNNQIPDQSVINQALENTSAVTIFNNSIYNHDGVSSYTSLSAIPNSIEGSTRRMKTYPTLTTYTQEESYYIPVFIKRNNRQIVAINFDVCSDIISSILNQPLGDGGLIKEPDTPVINPGVEISPIVNGRFIIT